MRTPSARLRASGFVAAKEPSRAEGLSVDSEREHAVEWGVGVHPMRRDLRFDEPIVLTGEALEWPEVVLRGST